MVRGKHCEYKAMLKKTDIEPMVIEAIREIVRNEEYAQAIKKRIGVQIDTKAVDKELEGYQAKLKEVDLNKTRLEREIDSLPADAKYRERKLHDMTLRLDSLYDVIVELEEKIEDARLRRDAIKQQAITLENIYKIMVNFDCVYNIINDEEKRNVVTALIKEIEIYRNDESEYPLKRIGLNFPVFKDGGEVTELLWDKGNTVETYFLLSALSYPFIGLYNAGAALFRAQGNSKISMMSSLVMNVVNIGGNAILIFGFKMGVMGAALASLVSRAVACCAVLFLLQKPGCMLRVTGLSALKPDGKLIRRILRVGIPAGIENGMFQIGKLSVASLTSTLGTAAIAANAVANTTSTFLNIPASAVGMAVLTVVGQCLGAGEKEQAVWYARRLLLVAYCGAWVMNLSAFFFADRWALSWFSLSPEASAMALEVMMWFNIVSLFFWPSSFTLPNILRAAGDASFTMTVSIVSMWVFRVGFCYLWVLKMGGGLLSIWMGMYLDWAFRSICFMVRFVRGKWLEQKVI